MAEPRRSYPGLESNRALINPFEGVVGVPQALEYEGVRPDYPAPAYDAILSNALTYGGDVEGARPADGSADERGGGSAGTRGEDGSAGGRGAAHLTVVDIGAGTGQFTRGLVERGVRTIALEPAGAMRRVLQAKPWATRVRVVDGTAEETGLEASSVDVVVWAQCYHWLDVPAAASEAARILKPHGTLAVVANQMDVSVPWVHRLSRIMRSGDVVRADRPPRIEPAFEAPALHQFPWVQELSVEEVMALARTRSSYLHATEARREKMQENLAWYLREHMGFSDDAPVHLPYVTFVWTASPSPTGRV